MIRRLALSVSAALVMGGAALAQAPPGLSDNERRAGAQAHPQLVAQFGGAMSGRQADYVRTVGQNIAVASGQGARAQDYTVTLLNSNANNAFAIPGGYVYITRQLLALMNDEAELAFVMGHEVAHVAARHGQKRQNRAALSSILAGLAGAVTGSDIVGQGAGILAQVTTLGYSREQERQADSLGVRYLTAKGYDPMASGDILAALGAQTRLESELQGKGGAEPAKWLSTHPATDERVARILAEARTLVAQAGPRTTNRDRFLDAIDGMPYDDEAGQGSIEGRRFRHPQLGITFEAPQGFTLSNGAEAVTGTGPNGARFTFAGGSAQGQTMEAYAARVWQQAGARGSNFRPVRIGQFDAQVSNWRGNTRQGPVDATLVVYRWSADTYYHILAIGPVNGTAMFDPLIESVRRLNPGEAQPARSRRVQVVRVGNGDTINSLAARMAYDDDRIARFLTLNHLRPNVPLTPGSRVKLIVWR
jgi:predicted Zn-dependent protease